MQGTYTGDVLRDLGDMSDTRPEIIGGVIGWDTDGHFTEVVYFTSEAEARKGEETMDSDPETAETMQRWMSQVDGMRYLDLPTPRLGSR